MFRSLFSLIFLLCSVSFSMGQSIEENDTLSRTLLVGVSDFPPYSVKSPENLWDGISVDLWRQLADEQGLVFEFREVPKDSLLRMLEKGELDVALGINASSQGEALVDFSPVYFISHLGAAGTSQQSLSSIAAGILTYQFLEITIWISTLLLIIGVLIWLAERKGNPEQFGGDRSIWSGIGSGFWWAGVTMTTIGYGDKAPATFLGRALALLWMLVAMAITASLTAAIVSAVGFDHGKNVKSVDDLRGRKVGVVAGSPTAAFLEAERIKFRKYPSVVDGLTALQEDKIKIFVDDVAGLRYALNENADFESEVEAVQLNYQYHAFAWQEDFPLQEELNRKMLEIMNSETFSGLLNRYVPK